MDKIKVIIKRPGDKVGNVKHINLTLENLQGIVGGPIETVTVRTDPTVVMILNEEGKLRGLKPNFMKGSLLYHDIIVGTVIVCGAGEEDFTDLPIPFEEWKMFLKLWGNDV